jgi:hypothetical protein
MTGRGLTAVLVCLLALLATLLGSAAADELNISAGVLGNNSSNPADSSSGSSYDYTLGNASLWHSEVTYCNTANYLTRTYTGYTQGFVPTYKIEVRQFCGVASLGC